MYAIVLILEGFVENFVINTTISLISIEIQAQAHSIFNTLIHMNSNGFWLKEKKSSLHPKFSVEFKIPFEENASSIELLGKLFPAINALKLFKYVQLNE